jgi:hypothetical protein
MKKKKESIYGSGFDSRIFLTEAEFETYKRRRPVRHVRTGLSKARPKLGHCEICGKPETTSNPLQAAHIIPFAAVIWFGLTPDYVDRPENLKWAHRSGCNKAVSITRKQVEDHVLRLRNEGRETYENDS